MSAGHKYLCCGALATSLDIINKVKWPPTKRNSDSLQYYEGLFYTPRCGYFLSEAATIYLQTKEAYSRSQLVVLPLVASLVREENHTGIRWCEKVDTTIILRSVMQQCWKCTKRICIENRHHLDVFVTVWACPRLFGSWDGTAKITIIPHQQIRHRHSH